MALISDILNSIDSAAAEVLTNSAFSQLAGSLDLIVKSGSMLIVILFGINMMIQVVPVSPGAAMMGGLKIALVAVFFDSWANFFTVYDALTNAPAQIGADILQSFGLVVEGDLYDSLDNVYSTVLGVSTSIAQNGGTFSGPLSALVVFLVAALMATISIFVLGIAKIGIAVFGAIAPAMIACALFKPTMPIFEAWIKQAISFSFIPLLVATVCGVIFSLFEATAPASLTSISTLGETISFVVVAMVGTGLLLQIPSMAGAFGQTTIAVGAVASNAYANAKAMPGRAVSGGKATYQAGKAGLQGFNAAAGYIVAPAATAAGSPAAGAAVKAASAGASHVARNLDAAEARKAAMFK